MRDIAQLCKHIHNNLRDSENNPWTKLIEPNRQKSRLITETHVEAEGPSRGFSGSGWNENLPSCLSAHCPWEFPQQSLTIMVEAKAIKCRITNREMIHVLSFRSDIRLKNGNGIFCSLSNSSALSSVDILGNEGGNGIGIGIDLISTQVWSLGAGLSAIWACFWKKIGSNSSNGKKIWKMGVSWKRGFLRIVEREREECGSCGGWRLQL